MPYVKNDRMIEELTKSKGLVSVAARRLGVARSTITRRALAHESVQDAIDEARAAVGDDAESALYKAIKKGEAWAVCFYLKTQCKDRGYVERHHVQGDFNHRHGVHLQVVETVVATRVEAREMLARKS